MAEVVNRISGQKPWAPWGAIRRGLEATVGGKSLKPQMPPVSCSWSAWTQWYAAYANMQTQTNEGMFFTFCPARNPHIRTDAWPHTTYEVMLGQRLRTQVLLSLKHKACLCMSGNNSMRTAKMESLSRSKYTKNIPNGINMNNCVENGRKTYSHAYSCPCTTYCIYSAINPAKAHIIQNMWCSTGYLHYQSWTETTFSMHIQTEDL